MSEEVQYAVSDEADFSGADLQVQPDPIFEGAVKATVASIREIKGKDKLNGELNGRKSLAISYKISEPLTETLPEGEEGNPREFNPGYRISQFIDYAFAEGTKDVVKRINADALSEFKVATRVAKKGEVLTKEALAKAIGKPVVLSLFPREDKKNGGWRQGLRVKASSNGAVTH